MGIRTLVLSGILLGSSALLAEAPEGPGERQIVARGHQLQVRGFSFLESEVLRKLTQEQLAAFLTGTPPGKIVLPLGGTLEDLIDKHAASMAFDLSWYSIDGGGSRGSIGGAFSLAAVIGQPDARLSSGGQLTLTGGFLAAAVDPCSTTSAIFCNGFELGDLSSWGEVSSD